MNLDKEETPFKLESKRDPVINQVPIATKQALLNYGTLMKTLAVTKCKEESPHKPETTLLCVRSRSKNVFANRFPIEKTNKPEEIT